MDESVRRVSPGADCYWKARSIGKWRLATFLGWGIDSLPGDTGRGHFTTAIVEDRQTGDIVNVLLNEFRFMEGRRDAKDDTGEV